MMEGPPPMNYPHADHMRPHHKTNNHHGGMRAHPKDHWEHEPSYIFSGSFNSRSDSSESSSSSSESSSDSSSSSSDSNSMDEEESDAYVKSRN